MDIGLSLIDVARESCVSLTAAAVGRALIDWAALL
jgi:hypothetical protein